MSRYFLFVDGSLDPKIKAGVGGCLLIPESRVESLPRRLKPGDLNPMLALKQFQGVSSTDLELKTLLWALEQHSLGDQAFFLLEKLLIHTDSQCVAGLLSRRNRLEANGFYSKRGKGLLKNASLYKACYQFHDQLKFDVKKVAGHMPSGSRNAVQRVFAFLDQRVRKELRQWVGSLKGERPLKDDKSQWHVYMIRCHDGSLYTGISNDVARRFAVHEKMGKQGAKYLRGRGPLELVFQQKTGSRSSALKMERMIKKCSKSKKELMVQTGEIDSVLTVETG